MLISKAALGPAKSKCNILGATFLALSALCRALTPDFDPTIVNWNHPDVEYLMKHFKMAMASHDDEIAALRKSNEDLRRAYGEPEAKCKALLEMYNRLAGKGAVAASGAGCSDAAAAPLPCGSVPALKLRHCHTTTLPRGTSAPALAANQVAAPSSPAAPMSRRRSLLLQKCAKSADHAKSAIGAGPPCGPAASQYGVAAFHQIREDKVRRPYSIVPFLVFMRFSFPVQSGGLPYASAISYACGISPYVFAASHAIPRPPIHRPSPHMVSRFPHTVTRLTHFPIRFGRSP